MLPCMTQIDMTRSAGGMGFGSPSGLNRAAMSARIFGSVKSPASSMRFMMRSKGRAFVGQYSSQAMQVTQSYIHGDFSPAASLRMAADPLALSKSRYLHRSRHSPQ